MEKNYEIIKTKDKNGKVIRAEVKMLNNKKLKTPNK